MSDDSHDESERDKDDIPTSDESPLDEDDTSSMSSDSTSDVASGDGSRTEPYLQDDQPSEQESTSVDLVVDDDTVMKPNENGTQFRKAYSGAQGERSYLENDANAAVDLSRPRYYLNRELSELAFQQRVLHEALDERNPLLERVKFLSIVTQNMDEFFRKRIGGLKQQIAADVTEKTADGLTPQQQWSKALDTARELLESQAAGYCENIRPALAAEGIEILEYKQLSPDEQTKLRSYFEESVLPTLTPLTFDPTTPFPFISNQSLSLAVLTREDDETLTFSRVKIPRNQVRIVPVENTPYGGRYVLLEEIVKSNLDLLFPDVEIVDCGAFRVTRNAEVGKDEDVAEDLVEMIEEVIEERRFATVVRLEVESGMPEEALEVLLAELDLDEREVFELDGPLEYRDFMTLTELDRPDLQVEDWTPQPHPQLDNRTDLFEEIREGDVLIHHPYHSFTDTVERFLRAAANDPNVLAIKATIYRTANDSKVIESLIEAARNGKQVAVVVELKARFDEENNVEWAKRLEEEGIHVAYGTMGYKAHTKTLLVVREEGDGVQLYSHVGTGNYHSETAKRYEDLGLLTADRDVGQDLVKLFNFFTGHSRPDGYRKLLVAPGNMRTRFTELIREEARRARDGEEARIIAKMNRLEDPSIIAELYEASIAGVEIDLVVRDICRLRPGLNGVSESIRVHSVVGRFLEHSRIFYFHSSGDGRYFIGSADWMTRNLDNRVESVVPIEDPSLQAELQDILDRLLMDNRQRWTMGPDGTYEQCHPSNGEADQATQDGLMRLTKEGDST